MVSFVLAFLWTYVAGAVRHQVEIGGVFLICLGHWISPCRIQSKQSILIFDTILNHIFKLPYLILLQYLIQIRPPLLQLHQFLPPIFLQALNRITISSNKIA